MSPGTTGPSAGRSDGGAIAPFEAAEPNEYARGRGNFGSDFAAGGVRGRAVAAFGRAAAVSLRAGDKGSGSAPLAEGGGD
jgi:hypothetical protein